MRKNGPNKTVAAWRRKNPFPARQPRPISDFVEWLSQQARAGVVFANIDEARATFAKETKGEA